jgi:hypothetical protein
MAGELEHEDPAGIPRRVFALQRRRKSLSSIKVCGFAKGSRAQE